MTESFPPGRQSPQPLLVKQHLLESCGEPSQPIDFDSHLDIYEGCVDEILEILKRHALLGDVGLNWKESEIIKSIKLRYVFPEITTLDHPGHQNNYHQEFNSLVSLVKATWQTKRTRQQQEPKEPEGNYQKFRARQKLQDFTADHSLNSRNSAYIEYTKKRSPPTDTSVIRRRSQLTGTGSHHTATGSFSVSDPDSALSDIFPDKLVVKGDLFAEHHSLDTYKDDNTLVESKNLEVCASDSVLKCSRVSYRETDQTESLEYQIPRGVQTTHYGYTSELTSGSRIPETIKQLKNKHGSSPYPDPANNSTKLDDKQTGPLSHQWHYPRPQQHKLAKMADYDKTVKSATTNGKFSSWRKHVHENNSKLTVNSSNPVVVVSPASPSSSPLQDRRPTDSISSTKVEGNGDTNSKLIKSTVKVRHTESDSNSSSNPGMISERKAVNSSIINNFVKQSERSNICRQSSSSSLISANSFDGMSTDDNLSDYEEDFQPRGVFPKKKASLWGKVRRAIIWQPFIQSYKKRYPWIQLAGHQGNFKAGSNGAILKKASKAEILCLRKLMDDVLRPYIPEYKGEVKEDGEHYVEMQDLLADFDTPSVMDCKMGTRTYLEDELLKCGKQSKVRKDLYEKMVGIDPAEPTDKENEEKGITKPRYMQWREKLSSTANLGFRIEGIKRGEQQPDKDFKKTKTKEDIAKVFSRFIQHRKDIQLKYIRRLKAIRATLDGSSFFNSHEVIGSSLLFVHDDSGNAGVWLIDFGKTTPLPEGITVDHRKEWTLGNREDGYLFGLDNVIDVWENTL